MLALSLYSCTALTCIGLGRSWCISTGTEFFLNRFRWVACVGTRGRTSLHPLFLSCAFLFLLFFVYLFVFCGSIWHLLPRKYRIYIYILLGCFSLFASYPDRVCCSFILLWLSDQCLIFITSLSVSSSCCFCSRGQVRWVELSRVELSWVGLRQLSAHYEDFHWCGIPVCAKKLGSFDLEPVALQMKDRLLHKSIVTIPTVTNKKVFSTFEEKMNS